MATTTETIPMRTCGQLSRLIGVSAQTVANYVHNGILIPSARAGKILLFNAQATERARQLFQNPESKPSVA
jgi:DNA-binding transcriptional MerR regulator